MTSHIKKPETDENDEEEPPEDGIDDHNEELGEIQEEEAKDCS